MARQAWRRLSIFASRAARGTAVAGGRGGRRRCVRDRPSAGGPMPRVCPDNQARGLPGRARSRHAAMEWTVRPAYRSERLAAAASALRLAGSGRGHGALACQPARHLAWPRWPLAALIITAVVLNTLPAPTGRHGSGGRASAAARSHAADEQPGQEAPSNLKPVRARVRSDILSGLEGLRSSFRKRSPYAVRQHLGVSR